MSALNSLFLTAIQDNVAEVWEGRDCLQVPWNTLHTGIGTVPVESQCDVFLYLALPLCWMCPPGSRSKTEQKEWGGHLWQTKRIGAGLGTNAFWLKKEGEGPGRKSIWLQCSSEKVLAPKWWAGMQKPHFVQHNQTQGHKAAGGSSGCVLSSNAAAHCTPNSWIWMACGHGWRGLP